MQFKTEQLKKQWESGCIDPKLEVVARMVDRFFTRRCYDVTVTSLNRTPEENRAVGGHPLSAHLCGRAMDIRTRDMSAVVLSGLIDLLATSLGDNFLSVNQKSDHLHVGVRFAFRSPGYDICTIWPDYRP